MAIEVPGILRESTGTATVDMLRDVQFASQSLLPDYAAHSRLLTLGVEQSEICRLLDEYFWVTLGSFIPDAKEAIELQGGKKKRYDIAVHLLGKLAAVGDYLNPATRSRILLLTFDDIELLNPVSMPPNLEDQLDLIMLLGACKTGLVDVPCMAVKRFGAATCGDYVVL